MFKMWNIPIILDCRLLISYEMKLIIIQFTYYLIYSEIDILSCSPVYLHNNITMRWRIVIITNTNIQATSNFGNFSGDRWIPIIIIYIWYKKFQNIWKLNHWTKTTNNMLILYTNRHNTRVGIRFNENAKLINPRLLYLNLKTLYWLIRIFQTVYKINFLDTQLFYYTRYYTI